MNYTLTHKQNIAYKKALEWYKNEPNKRMFTIAGYAGTGKTTLVRTIIEGLGLCNSSIAFCAYTGMASGVLTRNGNPATTIHKLIYDTIPIKDPKTGKVDFIFKLKEELDNPVSLIIIDEIPMISNEMLEEINQFGIKIIGLGDPGQLGPVGKPLNEVLGKPDVFLDEIMRQSMDNPIIYISMLARENKSIPYGEYGGLVQVVQKNAMTEDMFLFSDQIIAGKNKTVQSLNNFYRSSIIKKDSPLPSVGEKLICLKNNWDLFINEGNIETFMVNGLIGTVVDDINTIKTKTKTFRFGFQPTYNNVESFKNILGDSLYFTDGIREEKMIYDNYDKYKGILRLRNPMEETEKINKFTYAYCVTVYKSQGSEFNNVLYIDEYLSKQTYQRQLYTAITRAKEKLIIVK